MSKSGVDTKNLVQSNQLRLPRLTNQEVPDRVQAGMASEQNAAFKAGTEAEAELEYVPELVKSDD